MPGCGFFGLPPASVPHVGAAGRILAAMVARQALLQAATNYLRSHPEELARILRNAMGLRVGVPIAGLCHPGMPLMAKQFGRRRTKA